MVKVYIKDDAELTYTARRIVNRHPWGYQSAMAQGGRGMGKTAFCMHTTRQVYQYIYGVSKDDAWKMVLNHMLFSIQDVVKALEILDSIDMKNILEWQKNNTVPCYIWDDAGMHGGKYKFFVNVKMVDYLKGLMDTMRFVTSGFLINAPELSGLLGFIREYRDQLIIDIGYRTDGMQQGGEYGREANIKHYVTRRNGGKQLRTINKTKFSCYVDKWVYSEYSRMKARAIIENKNELKRMEELAKKMEQKREEKMVE